MDLLGEVELAFPIVLGMTIETTTVSLALVNIRRTNGFAEKFPLQGGIGFKE